MSDISSASGETDSHLEHIFPLNEEEQSRSCFSQLDHMNNNQRKEPIQTVNGAGSHSVGPPIQVHDEIEEQEQKSEISKLEFDSDEEINEDSDSDLFADEGEEEDTPQQASSVNPSSSAALSANGNAPLDLHQATHLRNHSSQHEQRKKTKTDHNKDEEEDGKDADDSYMFSQSFLDSSAQDAEHEHDENISSQQVSFSQTGNMSNTQQASNSIISKKLPNKIKGNASHQHNNNEKNRGSLTDHIKENSQNDFARNSQNIYKKQYRRYQDFASLIPGLGNFDWYETSAFQNKLLPIKFLTPASFWFMVCSEYFPRSMVYQNEETVLKDINKRLERLPIELTNRACKYNAGKTSNNAFSSAARSFSNEDNKEEASIQNDLVNDQIQTSEKTEEGGITQLEIELEDLLRREPVQELCQARLSQTNKYFYNFDDDLFIVQNRMFLLESMKNMKVLEGQNEEIKLQELNKLDLDKLINLLTVSYQRQQRQTSKGFQKIMNSMKQEFKEEQRVNDAKDIDFSDMLVDLLTLNPIELEFIRFLESKQQADSTANKPINDTQIVPQNQNNQSYSSFQPSKSLQTTTPNTLVKQTEEAHCQVCNETDYADNDLIVFCSRCNLSVHQKCYGIPNASQEDWICDACKSFGPSAQYLRCALCSKRGGALKRSKMPLQTTFFESLSPAYHEYLQTVIANSNQANGAPEVFDVKAWEAQNKKKPKGEDTQSDESIELYFDFQTEENHDIQEEEALKKEPVNLSHIWVHLTCALWVQECYFEERSSMNLVKGIESIDKKRFNLICSVCKQKKIGCCIQCAKGKCAASFHPECARRAGLSMEVRPLEKVSHQVFCQRHTPLKLRRILEQKEKKNKEEISKFCRSIEKYNETYFNEYKAHCKEKQLKPSKALQRKALKDQEKEDLEFMNYFSEHLLGINSTTQGNDREAHLNQQRLNPQEAYDPSSASKGNYSHLKTQMASTDEVWNQIEFKGYSSDFLYRMYKRLIRQKKAIFKGIFNTLKKNRDKLQEEIASRYHRQQRKEQILLKKEQIRLEKEEKRKKRLNEIKRLNNAFREESSADLKKRKYQQEGYLEENRYHKNSHNPSRRKLVKLEQLDQDQKEGDGQEELKPIENDTKMEVVEEDKLFFCYCQRVYNEGEVMIWELHSHFTKHYSSKYVNCLLFFGEIECAECEEWFHFECIGYIGSESQAQSFDFCCNECNFDGKRAKNKEIYQNLFDPLKAKYLTYMKKITKITIPQQPELHNNTDLMIPEEQRQGEQDNTHNTLKGNEEMNSNQQEEISDSAAEFQCQIDDDMKRLNIEVESIKTVFKLKKDHIKGIVEFLP